MARLSREFVKLETRLLNDYRFFTMTEFEQLVFIKLLGISRSTGNKIPKKIGVIGELLRTKRPATEIKSAINRIKVNFEKFKENKYFFYFEDYELRLNNSALKNPEMGCVDEDTDIDEDKDVYKEEKNKPKPSAPPVILPNPKEEEEKLYIKSLVSKVRDTGFEIDKFINTPANKHYITKETIIAVCESYLKDPSVVKDQWAWFKVRFHDEYGAYSRTQAIKSNPKGPGMVSISDLLNKAPSRP